MDIQGGIDSESLKINKDTEKDREPLTFVLQVMLAGEPRQAEVIDGPPVLTQPVKERRNIEILDR